MLRFLSDDQAVDLSDQLSSVLTVDQVAAAVEAIDFMCAWADATLRVGGKVQKKRQADLAHFADMLEHGEVLQRLLREQRPLVDTLGLDWPAFDLALARVVDSARVHAARPETRRGRKPEEWRDRLIAVVFSIYPPGAAHKSANSHFEQTVEMLFGFLGKEVEDVHGVIVDALRRRPDPPFTVRPLSSPNQVQ